MVGERIRTKREEMKLSQRALAKACGVSQPTISALESSTKAPSTTTISMVAKALNTTVSELLGEEKELVVNPDDKLKREAIYLLDGLSPAAQEQAMSYLRFLANEEGKK